ncbi:MAG: NusG domain II-containing protein [Bacilli bacterium]
MNKNDVKLIIIILIIVVSFFTYFYITKTDTNKALVYHNNDLILEINLNINNNYEVNGDNGKVIIEVLNKKIKVISENSPNHLCSKQGYIEDSYQSIVCLPNHILIQIPNNSNIDTQVK